MKINFFKYSFLADIKDISSHVRHLVKRANVFKTVPESKIIKTPAGFLPNFTAEYLIRYFYFADMKDSQFEDVTLASQVLLFFL